MTTPHGTPATEAAYAEATAHVTATAAPDEGSVKPPWLDRFVLSALWKLVAVVLLARVLNYQQLEKLLLNPRLSAKTMEVNGAVPFGAALAGGAIAGPMGAFMALPVAAMVTALVENTGKRYDVVFQTRYDADQDTRAGDPATGTPRPQPSRRAQSGYQPDRPAPSVASEEGVWPSEGKSTWSSSLSPPTSRSPAAGRSGGRRSRAS
jgi:hypothetical protein